MKPKLQLSSIILFCFDIQKMKTFYNHILGFEILESSGDNWIVLESGACQLCLHQIGQEYIVEGGSQAENRVTKFVLTTDQNIHDLRKYLLNKEVRMKEVMTWKGYDYSICDGRDPEGNVFQLKGKKIVKLS